MTTTFLESPLNDFSIDSQGRLAIVTGADAVRSDARSAVQAQRGEMVLALLDGLPTQEVAWDGWRPGQFEAAVRQEIMKVPGVRSVSQVTVSRAGSTLRYDAVIESIYGTVVVNA